MKIATITKTMDQLRDELDQLRPIAEDRLDCLNEKLRVDWNYHSMNHKVFNLNASQIKEFILHHHTAGVGQFDEFIKLQAHDEVLKNLEFLVGRDLPITEKLIMELHHILMDEPYTGQSKEEPGKYKTKPNYYHRYTGERIECEPPQEVPRLMNELVNWLNNQLDVAKREKKQYDMHPLMIACAFNLQFIKIHPFSEGNGRMAHILMNLILMKCDFLPAIIREHKVNEYLATANLSSFDNPIPLAEFIGDECIESLETAIIAAKGEDIGVIDILDKKLSLLKQEMEDEDRKAEKKIKLRVKTVHSALNNWGYSLFKELANTTAKFNEFYAKSNHTFSLIINDKEQEFNFTNELPIESVESILNHLDQKRYLSEARIILHCNYSIYKKRVSPSFDCEYRAIIRFDEETYDVLAGYLDPFSTDRNLKSWATKPLQEPLLPDEIKDLNKHWGETLYQNLVFYRNNG